MIKDDQSEDQPKNATGLVSEYLGQTVYVKDLAQRKNLIAEGSGYFLDCVGIVKKNPEQDPYYDYLIYYPSLDNSCLMHGVDSIEIYTKEEYPEYFL